MTLIAIGVVAAAWLTFLAFGARVLIGETLVEPGTSFVVQGHGDVGDSKQASLVCRYFTGRSVVTSVFWYSPNNVMGKDECPILTRAQAI